MTKKRRYVRKIESGIYLTVADYARVTEQGVWNVYKQVARKQVEICHIGPKKRAILIRCRLSPNSQEKENKQKRT